MSHPVIELTGSLRIRVARADVDAGSLEGRRAGVALARLAVEAGHTVSRDALADALWGERPPRSWRPALRNEIAAIRAVLAAPALEGGIVIRAIGDGYRLELPPGATVDITALSTVVTAAENAEREGEHERARRLAAEAVVTASRTVLAGAVGDWVDSIRDRVADLRERAERAAGEAALALGDHAVAESMARALIAAAPLREDSHRLLMATLWAGGNIGAALNAYEACRRLLADEVGSFPSEKTQALFLEILRSPDSTSAGTGSPAAGRRGPAPSTLLLLERQTTLVGREALLDRLAGRLDAGRQFVAIGGEPGAGKTLLAARLAVRAHAAGMSVLYGCADDRIALAHGPFLEALDTYFAAFEPAETVLALGAHGAVLGRLLPSMSAAASPAFEDDDPEQVAEAIAHGVRVAAADRGALLVLDDMQWAADESLAVLERIWADRLPALVLVLHRRFEDPVALQLEGMERIELEPLTVEEVAALARGLGRDSSRETAAMVWRQSGGNPLLATELLCWSAGATRYRLRRIVELLHERMVGLPAGAEDVLATAAVAGVEFDPLLVVAASSGDPEDAQRSLAAAERASMLASVPDGPGRLAFRHGLLRSSILETLETSARMRVHQRLGDALDHRFRRAEDSGAPGPRVARTPDPTVCEDVVTIVSRVVDALRMAGDPVPGARLNLEFLLHDALDALGRNAPGRS